MVAILWLRDLAGEGEAPRCLSRYSHSRVVSSSDACKAFLGFLTLPLQFLHLTPLVSFSSRRFLAISIFQLGSSF